MTAIIMGASIVVIGEALTTVVGVVRGEGVELGTGDGTAKAFTTVADVATCESFTTGTVTGEGDVIGVGASIE